MFQSNHVLNTQAMEESTRSQQMFSLSAARCNNQSWQNHVPKYVGMQHLMPVICMRGSHSRSVVVTKHPNSTYQAPNFWTEFRRSTQNTSNTQTRFDAGMFDDQALRGCSAS
ncbi:hypothetical protein MYCTH_93602 [Thermothelomyces thermophilus ATCC 42464]|uniref:Uncharacterized protein n=1 Tax=Thermothelomyces thermophilus (strain ATCC 42464 / BCRC 31852 / DSM 1799) TaxID=573729 RepID=G2QCU2_THET4|nr:uncharacterized protein MYCTH_93602 [Thermothelomyces thermophilus ATCC 42464]AEO58213.1 hypothetical protein MYCTH_93602 [Thermothelomyces thermophilus ATCC 42464]